MSAAITLAAGELSVVVEPAFGGRISAFRHGDIDLLHPIPDAAPRDLVDMASGGSFPLVPWSNRIRDARLTLGGETHLLSVTEHPAGHAIHGHGLRQIWSAEQGPHAVILRYGHVAGGEGWPWSYVAEQRFSLSETVLSVTLAVANTSHAAMPAGLGLHPYFPRTSGTRITCPVETAWPPTEADKFPAAGATAVPVDQDRSEPGPVPLGLDQGYGGWSGLARIAWPERGLALTMTGEAALGHVIVYTPPHRPYFCIEPVTHCIDAANLAENQGLAGTGHRMLDPGEEMAVTVEFIVEVI